MPALNNAHTAQCYQWRVLPQAMLNSPTMCQHHVYQELQPVHFKYPQAKIIHYMDDILIAALTGDLLQ
jgi:hypothetical protein